MCDYCDEKNTKEDCRGGHDIVYYNKKDSVYYLALKHFKNEVNEVEVKYCPRCGRNLHSDKQCIVDFCLYNHDNNCYYATQLLEKTIESVEKCPFNDKMN